MTIASKSLKNVPIESRIDLSLDELIERRKTDVKKDKKKAVKKVEQTKKVVQSKKPSVVKASAGNSKNQRQKAHNKNRGIKPQPKVTSTKNVPKKKNKNNNLPLKKDGRAANSVRTAKKNSKPTINKQPNSKNGKNGSKKAQPVITITIDTKTNKRMKPHLNTQAKLSKQLFSFQAKNQGNKKGKNTQVNRNSVSNSKKSNSKASKTNNQKPTQNKPKVVSKKKSTMKKSSKIPAMKKRVPVKVSKL